ncbi:TPA: hypothetical protein ACTADN_001897 [Salmonella enterica subsp. enterica serovar Birkenhead]
MNKRKNVFYGERVTSSNANDLHAIHILTPHYFKLKLLSMASGLSLEDTIAFVLDMGIEHIEKDFGCSFGVQEVHS